MTFHNDQKVNSVGKYNDMYSPKKVPLKNI